MQANEPKLVAVACADLHLSAKPPVARSCESDWLKTQAGYLNQLRKLVTSPTGQQLHPVLIAGDVFDSWKSSPEIVNVALSHLPHAYAIFGNHDLPNHDSGSLRRSAWWTLVKGGKITPLEPGNPIEVQSGGTILRLHGFPFGSEAKPLQEPHDLALEIAVVHAFAYTRKTGYGGAPKDQHVYGWEDKLKGYDVAVFGDNHRPFTYRNKSMDRACLLFNCGGLLRRKMDEVNHRPSVGLIYSDGTVKRHHLNVSQDQFIDAEKLKAVANGIDFQTFIEELSTLADAAIDFADAVRRAVDREKVPDEIKRIILSALEKE